MLLASPRTSSGHLSSDLLPPPHPRNRPRNPPPAALLAHDERKQPLRERLLVPAARVADAEPDLAAERVDDLEVPGFEDDAFALGADLLTEQRRRARRTRASLAWTLGLGFGLTFSELGRVAAPELQELVEVDPVRLEPGHGLGAGAGARGGHGARAGIAASVRGGSSTREGLQADGRLGRVRSVLASCIGGPEYGGRGHLDVGRRRHSGSRRRHLEIRWCHHSLGRAHSALAVVASKVGGEVVVVVLRRRRGVLLIMRFIFLFLFHRFVFELRKLRTTALV
ncbi:hypothetical protein PG987_013554 [Apiospora arundinis]